MRTLRTLDYKDARSILDFLAIEAAKVSNRAVIAVADPTGELIAFARMDDAPATSIKIAMNKAYSAARERKATREIGDKSRHPETGFDIAYYGDPRFVGWGGGVPVVIDGECVGSIAISGLPQLEDMRLAALAAEKFVNGSL